MKYKNLVVIGSSHVSIESVREIERTIKKEKPDIVAVELDKDRLMALLHKRGRTGIVKGVGFKGMLFGLIVYWIEKSVGKIVKIEPGSDLKMAVKMAQEQKAQLALIDQHITKTLKRFSQTFSWKEKWHFIVDIFAGLFGSKKQMKTLGLKEPDLKKVPSKEVIKKMMGYVKKRYPNLYNVLVHERNIVMANNLTAIMKRYPKKKIVAVIGAGHEDEIMRMIKQKFNKQKS